MGAGASSSSKGAAVTAAAAATGTHASSSSSESPSPAQFARAVAAAEQRKDDAFMRKVFDRHSDSKGKLTLRSLIAALKDIDAPVLANAPSDGVSAADSAQHIFRRTDTNLSGDVDYPECVTSMFWSDVLICANAF